MNFMNLISLDDLMGKQNFNEKKNEKKNLIIMKKSLINF